MPMSLSFAALLEAMAEGSGELGSALLCMAGGLLALCVSGKQNGGGSHFAMSGSRGGKEKLT
jgi:hypothetical protein